jgi:hypothetical protein
LEWSESLQLLTPGLNRICNEVEKMLVILSY